MKRNGLFESHIFRAKRLFDLVFASLALLVTLPLFPLIALAIKATSKGNIIYKQLRVGRSTPEKMELFEIMKFRTMYCDAESRSGAVWATENDPRITPVGRFLRKTRLDELPQLFNVLKGEMSLIGPRPERPDFYQRLEQEIPYFADRTYGVLPGITGLAQINQGYDTSIEDVRRKVGFDHSYALSLNSFSNWLQTDIAIIVKTIIVMVDGRGR
ncbi:sugar transferase [Vibrio vulnificus]|uniref:Sugar transferase involved in lipopolysaccharide synthesis n=3 Tax=Vibrio vulnificus TaxID=672 RepID=Q7ML12_VIBVY|nr:MULTISPECIES: sugar transferase [Vibrio]OJI55502.1 UDP-N-acetylgalactosamine-undecaprenyl-phosphate N-acetylgalactosaminephosphotransferase [Vibrio fluvialis]AAO11022.1 Sugar transferase involved in lipopolysaccharide synthesis [Vibrio vulnificus CMCP6]ADV86656.1 sugar transferase SypR involved in lipopolysaccharide synthesis [Vibrio vulnificus MO6-24/O]AIL70581.1 lipopolysaccharide synthesis sugar transferase [Vibrio vulnificus]ALM71001.1 Sugar transferase SypR [Vibrio vulnificus]